MKPLTAASLDSRDGPSASRRGAFRLLAIASGALLLSGLLTVAVSAAAPVAATVPSGGGGLVAPGEYQFNIRVPVLPPGDATSRASRSMPTKYSFNS